MSDTRVSDERLAELITVYSERELWPDHAVAAALRELAAARQARAEPGQPVAWRRRFGGNSWQLSEHEPALLDGWIKEPLYAALPSEPVAWRIKERINCGQGQWIDSDWNLLSFEPSTNPNTIAIEPLYRAAPPVAAASRFARGINKPPNSPAWRANARG